MKIKKILICPIFIFSSINFSFAQSQDLERIVTLAEDARDIMVESEIKDKVEFKLDNDTSEIITELQDLDHEIAAIVPSSVGIESPRLSFGIENPCNSEQAITADLSDRIKGRKFKIYFTGTFSSAAEMGLPEGYAGRNNFRNFMVFNSSTGHPDAFQIRTLSSLETKYLKTEKPKDWDELNSVQRATRLRDFAESFSGASPSLGLILSEYAIADMTANPDDWKSSLNEIKDHLTFDEKLKVASHFGGRFSDNYNSDRAAGNGPQANGIVTMEEMLSSVRDGVPGGVCRDVSQAQANMLMEMGVPKDKIYQTAYMTATGGHVVMAVQDPENPDRLVRINYDYTDEINDRTGGAALTQNSSLPDFGASFRIFDADGKPIGKIPSEFGQVLRDATQGRTLSDGLTRNHSLSKVYVETPIGVGSVFTGKTASGDNIIGVAVSKETVDERRNSVSDYGVAVVKREGDRATVSIDQTALYAYLNYSYHTPRYEKGNFSLGAKAGSNGELLIMDNTASYNDGRERSGTNIEGTAGFHVGADVKYSLPSNGTSITSGLTLHGYADQSNIQEGPQGGIRPVIDRIVWDTAVDYQVSENMKLIGESAIVMRSIGNTAAFKGTLEDYTRGLSASAFYQTPLSDEVPLFDPMAREAYGFGVEKSIGNPARKVNGSLSLEYVRDLDFNQNILEATMGIKF